MNKIQIFKRLNYKKLLKSDVIIYDEHNINKITKLFPEQIKKTVIKTRPSEIFINFNFNYQLIKNIIIFGRDIFKRNKKNIFINFISFLRDMRIKTIIQIVKPSLIFTFIDNQSRIGRVLEKYFPNINYIAVQNGLRSTWEFNPICKHDKYFSFSNRQLKILDSMGWKFNKTYANGSLRAALTYQDNKLDFNICRDILVISGWRGNIEIDNDYLKQIESLRLMNKLLFKYISQNKIRLSILTKYTKTDKDWYVPYYKMSEEDFYKSIYGSSVEIIKNKKKGQLLYEEAAKSKLSISTLSSAIYELYLYGLDAFYLNLHNSVNYHKDFPDEISYKITSQYNLNRILDNKLSKKSNVSLIKKKSNIMAKNNLKLLKKVIDQNIRF